MDGINIQRKSLFHTIPMNLYNEIEWQYLLLGHNGSRALGTAGLRGVTIGSFQMNGIIGRRPFSYRSHRNRSSGSRNLQPSKSRYWFLENGSVNENRKITCRTDRGMLIGWPELAVLANRTLPITLGVDTVDVAILELLTASDSESGADSPGIDT